MICLAHENSDRPLFGTLARLHVVASGWWDAPKIAQGLCISWPELAEPIGVSFSLLERRPHEIKLPDALRPSPAWS